MLPSQRTSSRSSDNSDPAYYHVLNHVLRSHGRHRRGQILYAVAITLLIVAACVWTILNGEIPSGPVTVIAILIIGLAVLLVFLIGPRILDLISLRHISKERVEECVDYMEQQCEGWELEFISQMAENDRNGIQTVASLMNTMWPALIALVLAGGLLPPGLITYLVIAGLFVFLVLPAALLYNGEREHADVVILQAILVCKERQERRARGAASQKPTGAITRKLTDT